MRRNEFGTYIQAAHGTTVREPCQALTKTPLTGWDVPSWSKTSNQTPSRSDSHNFRGCEEHCTPLQLPIACNTSAWENMMSKNT